MPKYEIEDGSLLPAEGEGILTVLSLEELAGGEAHVPRELLHMHGQAGGLRLEKHPSMTLMTFQALENNSGELPEGPLLVCVTKERVTIVTSSPALLVAALTDFVRNSGVWLTAACLPAYTLMLSVFGHHEQLEDIEDLISCLEDEVMDGAPSDAVPRISDLRRKLLKRKRFYEQLGMITEELSLNENRLLSEDGVRAAAMLSQRVERLLHTLLSLRDYVTQVREAYQSQVDIRLNDTMRLFTVLTALFVPPTLIVGWYGMNIQLPEFTWKHSYPFVIALCVFSVIGFLLYFKRNKWF